ncbi:hypothetical protein [Methylocella tundrae]|uniref:Phage tail tube protein n=1 Tax=Methylocella tundrae TaxID=227605 RepID=A0A4U8YYN2_METTU|nr:hypothetical protein [Methylocella tundrae]WPP05509.1 hypothetical protein SIN04_06705 [Methylocella tundrae]VFU07934.1 Phage tail tube protein [Methylocella tundrae]
MADFGGFMRFTVNGSPLTLRAKFESEPSALEMDGGANQNGSIYRTMKPMGYIFEPTFEDTPTGTATALDWAAIMLGGPYNISLVEEQTGRLHTWTGAQFEGKPRVDHMTGEVTGIKGRATAYAKTSS